MKQAERREYLLTQLLAQQPAYQHLKIPQEAHAQQQLLRALLNIRAPQACSDEFLMVQDAYLQACTQQKGVVEIASLEPCRENMYLWQGDITTLAVDAIVNAANGKLTGCYCPGHTCIDNCIHTFAGVQLRLACARLMAQQGHDEPTGHAKITSAYNLPCRYILHTVGPIITGEPTAQQEQQLAHCYRACFALAVENAIKSIAFCCISTGEFRFPNQQAAEIAIQTVTEEQRKNKGEIKVIWNVFKNTDYEIYRKLLARN